jgi:hypothetical protein
VLEHRRDARDGGRRTAGGEVLPLRVGGIHEVRMRLDHAGHHEEPGRVDRLTDRQPLGGHRGDPAAVHVHVRLAPAARTHDDASEDPELVHR